MGILVNFCAGTNSNILPAKDVDAILVNVPYNGIGAKAIKDTNLMFDYAACEYRFLDTGGYQYAVAEADGREIINDSSKPAICDKTTLNLTLDHVFYAMANLNINMANAMDFPIKKYGTDEENTFEFHKKVGFNLHWGKESARLKNLCCPDVELFLPIQCYDLDQLDYFLTHLGSVEFDGYSIPTRNFSINELALFLVRFYQLGIKKVHILGTSQFFTIAMAAYMARHYFEWISLDATTWREQAQNGNYLNQYNLMPEKIYNVTIDERIENDCICPFCKDKTFTYIKNLPQTERVDFLRCHNFWAIEKVTRELYDSAGTILTLEKYLKKKSSDVEKIDELIKILSLLDMYKGEDIKHVQTLLL
jgi:tRNA-guanine family transglycosylase